MDFELSRKILASVSGVELYATVTVAVCVFVLAATVLFFSERYRMVNNGARKLLRRLELSRRLMEGNDEYDISAAELASPADIDAARKTVRKLDAVPAVSIAACSLVLMAALLLTACGSTMLTANRHGYRGGLDVTPASLWTGIELSPEEDTVPGDIRGSIIYYYRFGCPDCEATHAELEPIVQSIATTWFVATRSDQGKAYLKHYPVATVPSCVYIKHDGSALYYTLYQMVDGKAVIDEDALLSLRQAVAYDTISEQKGA